MEHAAIFQQYSWFSEREECNLFFEIRRTVSTTLIFRLRVFNISVILTFERKSVRYTIPLATVTFFDVSDLIFILPICVHKDSFHKYTPFDQTARIALLLSCGRGVSVKDYSIAFFISPRLSNGVSYLKKSRFLTARNLLSSHQLGNPQVRNG